MLFRSFESRLQHVADEHVAQGVFPFGGADDGDRAGFEEGGEVVLFVHGECSVGAVWAARLSNGVACRGNGMLIGRNFRNFNLQECRWIGWTCRYIAMHNAACDLYQVLSIQGVARVRRFGDGAGAGARA